jgi:hypothetical protein
MAHFAIQLGNVGIDLEDEDLTAKALVKIGNRVLHQMIDLLDGDEDEDEEDDE